MAFHNELGAWGEQKAAEYLESKGWYIRHRDWRLQHYDIDIVAIDAEMSIIIFVEVKTRSTDSFGSPQEAVTLKKQTNIINAASAYLKAYHLERYDIRFDTISIVSGSNGEYTIDHNEGAFDIMSKYYYYENQRKVASYNARRRWS